LGFRSWVLGFGFSVCHQPTTINHPLFTRDSRLTTRYSTGQ
jgi:hypothetical protein